MIGCLLVSDSAVQDAVSWSLKFPEELPIMGKYKNNQ